MNKKAVAVAMTLGGALTVGGEKLVTALVTSAEAKGLLPYVHAVDLRRKISSDAGVSVLVFGHAVGVDGGGLSDIGQAKRCAQSPATQRKAAELMNALAEECSW